MVERVVETDVLVVGGGLAGCFAAIKAKEKGVTVTLVARIWESLNLFVILFTDFVRIT